MAALVSERQFWDWLPITLPGIGVGGSSMEFKEGGEFNGHLIPLPSRSSLQGTLLSFHPSVHVSICALPGSLPFCFRGFQLPPPLKQRRRQKSGWRAGQAEGMNEQKDGAGGAGGPGRGGVALI